MQRPTIAGTEEAQEFSLQHNVMQAQNDALWTQDVALQEQAAAVAAQVQVARAVIAAQAQVAVPEKCKKALQQVKIAQEQAIANMATASVAQEYSLKHQSSAVQAQTSAVQLAQPSPMEQLQPQEQRLLEMRAAAEKAKQKAEREREKRKATEKVESKHHQNQLAKLNAMKLEISKAQAAMPEELRIRVDKVEDIPRTGYYYDPVVFIYASIWLGRADRARQDMIKARPFHFARTRAARPGYMAEHDEELTLTLPVRMADHFVLIQVWDENTFPYVNQLLGEIAFQLNDLPIADQCPTSKKYRMTHTDKKWQDFAKDMRVNMAVYLHAELSDMQKKLIAEAEDMEKRLAEDRPDVSELSLKDLAKHSATGTRRISAGVQSMTEQERLAQGAFLNM